MKAIIILQELASKIVRIRDKDKSCIICGKQIKNIVAAHFFKKSQSLILSYDLRNIHGSCMDCNFDEENDIGLHYAHEFNLREREGESNFEKIKWLNISGVKVSKSEYFEKIKEYKLKLKELQK